MARVTRYGFSFFRNVRNKAGRTDVCVHIPAGSLHGHRADGSVLLLSVHCPGVKYNLDSACHFTTAPEPVCTDSKSHNDGNTKNWLTMLNVVIFVLFFQICTIVPHSWTSIHSNDRHYGKHLPNIQAQHSHPGTVYRLDDAGVDHVLLLRHHA